jgi:hypothetical protein
LVVMAATAEVPVGASARKIAEYLTELRGLVDRATAVRQSWIRDIGKVARAVKEEDPAAAVEAGVIGAEQRRRFEPYREELSRLVPPGPCEPCHLAVVGWLDKQIAACEVMVEIGQTGNVDLLRGTTGLLAEGRIDTARFRAEYTNLVAALNEHLRARRPARRKMVRWPFGRKRSAPSSP